MATKTFEELKQMAIQIRDEKTNKQNTATRIGTQMLEHLNKLEQEYYDKTNIDEQFKNTENNIKEVKNSQGIYNVDANIPLSSGQFYTAATARNAVPTDIRKFGLIITYKTDATTSATEQFTGSSVSAWTTETNWTNVGAEGGNKILAWNTDAATTRKQVVSKERKEGLMITYKNADGQLVNEQYKSTNYSDTEWVKDSNWLPIVSQYQLSPIEARAGYVVCSTASGTAAKTITKQNFVLDTKCRLLVKMTYSNTANLVTLNINNTGTIQLFFDGTRVGNTNS